MAIGFVLLLLAAYGVRVLAKGRYVSERSNKEPGSVFLNVNWNFRAPVRPGDVLTAEARVIDRHATKPVTTLATTVTNQEGVVVLD